MDRDEPVSQGELQLLIDDLRRMRERLAEELERRNAAAKESGEDVRPETGPVA